MGIRLTGIHHIRLTVTDLERSRRFYETLGLRVVVEPPPDCDSPINQALADVLFDGVVLQGEGFLLGLRPVAPPDDQFSENRVGLDHLSFAISDLSALRAAESLLDDHGIPHGPIADMTSTFGIYVMVIRDPDNIQVEITATA